MKRIIAWICLAAMVLTTGAVAEAADIAAIDWNARYTYAELEAQLKAIEKWDGRLPTYMAGEQLPFVMTK